MSEQIPVTFLCAVSRGYENLSPTAFIIDVVANSLMDDLVNYSAYLDVEALTGMEPPEQVGMYRFDGIAIPTYKTNSNPISEDPDPDYEFTGKFTAIMIPRTDWFEQGVE